VYNIDLPDSNQLQPTLFEDTLVFIDDEDSYSNLYMYNLKLLNLTQITFDNHTRQNPHIHRSKVVWEEYGKDNWDIYLYYISKNDTVQVTKNPSNQSNPFIFGNYIAWQDDRNGNWDIYIYDINTQKERQITSSSTAQISPKMSKIGMDTELIWIDKGEGGEDSEIFELRLIEFNEPLENIKQITDDTYEQIHIAASLDNMLYTCDMNGSYNIFFYNYETEVRDQISDVGFGQKYPVFDEENIVWTDKRTNYNEIYQFNLISREQTQLTESKTPKSSVQINNNWVVWVEDRGGDKDIGYLDLTLNALPENQAFNPQFIIAFFLLLGAGFILMITFKKPKPKYMPSAAEINKLRTKEDLTSMCTKYGLNADGNKKRLRNRLMVFVENEQNNDYAEPTGWEKMKLKLNKHYLQAKAKLNDSTMEELDEDESDEFDIEVDKTLEEMEEAPEVGRMDESLQEIMEGLKEQKEELDMLKTGLMSLDIKVKDEKGETGRPIAAGQEIAPDEDTGRILKILENLLEHSPENISIKYRISDKYEVIVKVVKKHIDQDEQNE
jgi:beta propeller repeat protein